MPSLDPALFNKVNRFREEGDALCEQSEFTAAIKVYQKGWNTLPEPRQYWDAGLWLKIAQAECYLELNDFKAAKQKLDEGILCSGAVKNPLLALLLGMCAYELNDKDQALIEFRRAVELADESILKDEAPNYWQFYQQSLKTRS